MIQVTDRLWFLFNAESTLPLDITGADVLGQLRAEPYEERIVPSIVRAEGLVPLDVQIQCTDKDCGLIPSNRSGDYLQ